MGMFDQVTKLTGLTGGGLAGNPALLKAVVQMMGSGESGGGLTNLVQGFNQAGLGNVVSSWVGKGENLPISAEQVQQGLGAARVQQLAQSAGMTEGAAASALAGILPSLVDRLTPDGAVPQAGQLQQLLSTAKTMFGA